MEDEKEEFIKHFEEEMDYGNRLKKLNEEISNYINEKEKNKFIQLKKDLLENLNIASKMFDKHSNIIFNDEELKLKTKEIYEKLAGNFNSY